MTPIWVKVKWWPFLLTLFLFAVSIQVGQADSIPVMTVWNSDDAPICSPHDVAKNWDNAMRQSKCGTGAYSLSVGIIGRVCPNGYAYQLGKKLGCWRTQAWPAEFRNLDGVVGRTPVAWPPGGLGYDATDWNRVLTWSLDGPAKLYCNGALLLVIQEQTPQNFANGIACQGLVEIEGRGQLSGFVGWMVDDQK